MITQNATLSNGKECKIKEQNKIFILAGLMLIGLSGTGPSIVTFSSFNLLECLLEVSQTINELIKLIQKLIFNVHETIGLFM